MTFPYYVYILRCANGRNYVGCTAHLPRRLERHRSGSVQYTRDKLLVQCILSVGFLDRYRAYAFEKYLKSGSGRAFSVRHFL